jgi:hypothetical protein
VLCFALVKWNSLPCLTFEFGVWALLLGLGCILGLAKCPLPIYPSMALVIKTNLILNFVFFFFYLQTRGFEVKPSGDSHASLASLINNLILHTSFISFFLWEKISFKRFFN